MIKAWHGTPQERSVEERTRSASITRLNQTSGRCPHGKAIDREWRLLIERALGVPQFAARVDCVMMKGVLR